MRIADNGSGIPPENLVKIFDAFFTTKPPGFGTGLGLAISHQIIVEKHGGTITCKSEVGVGTEESDRASDKTATACKQLSWQR